MGCITNKCCLYDVLQCIKKRQKNTKKKIPINVYNIRGKIEGIYRVHRLYKTSVILEFLYKNKRNKYRRTKSFIKMNLNCICAVSVNEI